jgi:hypothetical protein
VFFAPLMLGMLAIPLPFISLVLMMLFAAKIPQISIVAPHRLLLLFCVVPFASLAVNQNPEGVVVALNAILGVGMTVYVFLQAIRSKLSLSTAFAVSASWIVLFGTLRYLIWGPLLSQQLEEGLAMMKSQNVLWISPEMLDQTMNFLRLLWQVAWTASQLIALFLGFILFHKQIGLRFSWQMLRFPAFFALLPVVALPLYLVNDARVLFINLLIALCFLPFLQGIGVVLNKASRLISNKIVRGILLFTLLINAISYALITLLGLADQWWDFRKTNAGGNPE